MNTKTHTYAYAMLTNDIHNHVATIKAKSTEEAIEKAFRHWYIKTIAGENVTLEDIVLTQAKMIVKHGWYGVRGNGYFRHSFKYSLFLTFIEEGELAHVNATEALHYFLERLDSQVRSQVANIEKEGRKKEYETLKREFEAVV